jgi:hypothetical protein
VQRVYERPCQQKRIREPVSRTDHKTDRERHDRFVSPGYQDADERDGGKHVQEPVDLHQRGQPERQPAERDQAPLRHEPAARRARRCARAGQHQRVRDQAQATEQQHLRRGLAERPSARVLLRQREREHQCRGGSPLWAG